MPTGKKISKKLFDPGKFMPVNRTPSGRQLPGKKAAATPPAGKKFVSRGSIPNLQPTPREPEDDTPRRRAVARRMKSRKS